MSATRKPRKPNKTCATGFKGVRRMDYYHACIILPGDRKMSLGTYKTAEEAAKAYDKAAKELHGPLAYLNFPESAV